MKRQRYECPSWWILIGDEIISMGGYVNPFVGFSENGRLVTVNTIIINNDDKDNIDNDTNQRRSSIEPDTVLFRIPISCMITKDRAIDICPWLKDIEEDVHLHNSATDVMIAIAMASRSPSNLLYLQSLPESSGFDVLPRRWSDDDIEQRLGGTSLIERVKADKLGVIEDYKLLLSLFEKRNNNNQSDSHNSTISSFPSFDKFSDMLAAVSSRAFQIGASSDQNGDASDHVAIVPLLDLCDHSRGKTSSKKNVSYQIVKEEGGGVCGAHMLVKAAIPIGSGESLRLTYGAKGNSALLVDYGFSILNNLEPDGSSNDVFELQMFSSSLPDAEQSRTISLRTGPKLYSYGCFVMALEEFFEESLFKASNADGNDDEEQSSGPEDDADNGCESFLVDDGNEAFGGLYGGEEQDTKVLGRCSNSKEEVDQQEIKALQRFRQHLIKLSQDFHCKGTTLQTALMLEPGPPLYSAIFCQSELRTIIFFIQVINKVQQLLDQEKEFENCGDNFDVYLDPNDRKLIDEQTSQVAQAYMAIRHHF